MSAKDIPWLITINDKSNIAQLSKHQKMYYTLNVMNVEDKSQKNDKNNKSLCINKWNSLMNKTYMYDAFKPNNSNCLYMKQLQQDSLFAIHVEDDMIEYTQLNQENDNILNLILMNNSYLYYVSDMVELNGTLALHGTLLNPLSDLESIHDQELFHDLKMEYLENMFKL
jgi:hypothetical protein